MTKHNQAPETRPDEHYDVVVIGSGFGGSIAANRLAGAGLNVLVLERGPWRDSLPVRGMGIADRSPFPYGARFATHVLRSITIGRGGTPGIVHRRRGRRLRERGVGLVRRLVGTPRRGVVVNKRGMYEVFSYPGIDVVCVSGVAAADCPSPGSTRRSARRMQRRVCEGSRAAKAGRFGWLPNRAADRRSGFCGRAR